MAGNAEQAALTTGPRFDEAHRALRADDSVQFDLTGVDPPEPPPAWVAKLGEWIADLLRPVGRALDWINSLMPAAPYARILLWAVLILAALALVWLLVQRFRTGTWRLPRWRRREGEAEELEEEWAPEQGPARAWLKEADALAAAGNYAEAVHHLLRRSIEDIDYRRPQLVRPALTSRDLASAEAIPPQARALFGAIVGSVERSLFGGRKVTAGEWTATRDAYAEFALRRAWKS